MKVATAVTALICATAAPVLLDGCSLLRLKENVARIEAQGLIGGHVTRASNEGAPIIVVLSASPPAGVVDSFVLEKPGAYFFVVPQGTYQVAAFVDRNRDFTYQPNAEPAAYYGAPTAVPVAVGQKVKDIDVEIPAEPHVHLDLAISVGDLGKRGKEPPIQIGDVVTLDDPRFAAKNGELGLWQPVEFLLNVGAGFYFLQPFEPTKVPVLFVHGAGGTPRDWRYLIEHLDRSKFQPWVLYYPSGMSLDTLARGFARWMSAIAVRYEFQRFIIVAHSMGGLVSRAAINDMADRPVGGVLALFVTISSPWNGYGAAASGVKNSSVVMPMWVDMAPGSPFLERMFLTPLPPQCPYDLLFSYGGHSLLLRGANDGTVALSSELVLPAQHTAKKVYGFDADHMGILRSAEVSETLNTLLAGALQ
jgi:pimeloyl-ACP methyl ester carboxylesterase